MFLMEASQPTGSAAFKMQMAFPSWPISNFSSGTLICFHLLVCVFHLGCRELSGSGFYKCMVAHVFVCTFSAMVHPT